MQIAYVNGGRNVPSVQFRRPFFDRLRNRGHQCDFLYGWPARYDTLPVLGWRVSRAIERSIRLRHVRQLGRRSYDCVVLETGIFHNDDGSLETRLRETSRRLVYELDDAVFLLFPAKIEALVAMADHVIVANKNLANWTRQYHSSVSVIPTCIDEQKYNGKSYWTRSGNDPFVVGWVGSAGNVPMIGGVHEPLRRFASSRNVEIRVLTSRQGFHRLAAKDLPIRWIDIDRCDVVHELQQFDVGIMPLPSGDPWMNYKGNAKMLQYMAVGLPTIGSAIGFNLELIRDGVNGFLAGDEQQWFTRLVDLFESSATRESVGQQARETILDGFTVKSRIDQYEAILRGDG